MQTVLFTLMVRARDLRKSILDEHAAEAFLTASEVAQKVIARAGPAAQYASETAFLTALADETFRWVQNHLER